MLCGSLVPRDLDDAAKALTAAPSGLDFVEIRLDLLGQPLPFGLLADRRARVIVSCRHQRDGGKFEGSEADRFRILAESARSGVDVIDLELPYAIHRALLGIPPERLILSHHDFKGTPDDTELDRIVRAAASARPRWIKVATFAHHLSDNLRIFSLLTRRPELSIAAFCMGEKGQAGRLLARRFGSKLDYAALAEGDPTAPGQLTVEQWKRATPSAGVTGQTPLYGLLGRTLAHSLSPDLQNVFLRETGSDGLYARLPCDTFADGLSFAEKLGFRGLNVTMPFKDDARQASSSLGMSARRAGAVNTLCRIEAGVRGQGSGVRKEPPLTPHPSPLTPSWKGFNTDGPAFLKVLRAACGPLWPIKKRVLVLGAGGTASALARYLRRQGAVLFISSRSHDAARRLAVETDGTPVPWAERRDFRGDLIVNATPIGTAPDANETPIDPRVFRQAKAAFDLVYNPPVTRFLEEARSSGCTAISGLDMLVEQGARSFRLWTGRRAPTGDPFVRGVLDRFPR